jgi:hypothetical protein
MVKTAVQNRLECKKTNRIRNWFYKCEENWIIAKINGVEELFPTL